MLIRTSAPQPATMTTPTGGTVGGFCLLVGCCMFYLGEGRDRMRGVLRTEEGDEDEENQTADTGHFDCGCCALLIVDC